MKAYSMLYSHGTSHSELRMGQFISNFFDWLTDNGIDPFYVEDSEIPHLLMEYEREL